MKTNIELMREAGIYLEGYVDAANRLITLVEQRYRERLLGVKVDRIIEALEIGRDAAAQVAAEYHESMRGYRPEQHAARDADVAKIDAAIADQCAAMIEQSRPKRLTREQVDDCRGKAIGRDDAGAVKFNDQRFADAIQDALGIPKEQP